ncbi:MAG: hypothetical protein U0176_20345 [Bacteroidia bacterium]
MSKITLLKVESLLPLDAIVAFWEEQGLEFGMSKKQPFRIGESSWLDLTQAMDDRGTGLADKELYDGRLSQIERQAERKFAAGWSRTKVERWVLEKKERELEPMLLGAARWIDMLEMLSNRSETKRIWIWVDWNNDRLGEVEPLEGKTIRLSAASPLDLVRLAKGEVNVFER